MNIRRMMIAVLVLSFCGVCFSAGSGKADGKIDIKLASYNIRYAGGDRGANSWDNRKEPLANYINELKPDVIGMQEALLVQVEYMKANLDGYSMVGVGRDDGKCSGEFSPVFYNNEKYLLDSCGTFWLSETPEVAGSRSWNAACNRICSWVRLVDIASSKTFYVFNTHFDHQSQQAKDESAKLIAAKMAEIGNGGPAFLMGDFNSLPDSKPIKYLTGEGEDKPTSILVDSLAKVGTEESLGSTFNSFGRSDSFGRIDYILCPEDVDVVAGEVGPAKDGDVFLSDHNGIWTVVKF